MALLTVRRQRILTSLEHGDLLWEVPTEPYFTQFNERTGKQTRVHQDVLEDMEESGWIQRTSQDVSAHKLDFFEITPDGRLLLQELAHSKKGGQICEILLISPRNIV